MQITLKTTQNKTHKIDVEPADTVGKLKVKIESAHGYPAATQKVIYSGKILPDDKTIESCGVKEKDFFVLMVAKPKPTPAPKPQVPSTSTAAEAAPVTTPGAPTTSAATITSTESPAEAAALGTPPVTSEPPSSTPSDSSGFLTGEALHAAINRIVEMGFDPERVREALRASFNNPDRAVEYLMNGLPIPAAGAARPTAQAPATQTNPPPARAQPAPASVTPAASTPPAQASNQPQNLFQLAQQQQRGTAAGGDAGGDSAIGGGVPGGALDLGALRSNPQGNPLLASFQNVMAQDPRYAQMLLQQLARSDPELVARLASDPALALQILGGMESEGDDGQGGELPPGVQAIHVTEEERAAIARLEDLGFSRQAAIEAYFACDKNEELAVNYLLDRSFDD